MSKYTSGIPNETESLFRGKYLNSDDAILSFNEYYRLRKYRLVNFTGTQPDNITVHISRDGIAYRNVILQREAEATIIRKKEKKKKIRWLIEIAVSILLSIIPFILQSCQSNKTEDNSVMPLQTQPIEITMGAAQNQSNTPLPTTPSDTDEPQFDQSETHQQLPSEQCALPKIHSDIQIEDQTQSSPDTNDSINQIDGTI